MKVGKSRTRSGKRKKKALDPTVRVKSYSMKLEEDIENHEQINDTTSDEASTGGWKTAIPEEEADLENDSNDRITDGLVLRKEIS